MALYLGDKKVNVNLNGLRYDLNLCFINALLDAFYLLSSDNYILMDSTGLYLTVKEE